MTKAEFLDAIDAFPIDAKVVIEHDGPPGARSGVRSVDYERSGSSDPFALTNHVIVIR